MATASCQNCDRDDWELRKHPSNYSGGGPNCPDCGSTKVEVKAEGGEAQRRGGRRGQGGERRQQAEKTPKRREGGRGGGGGLPTTGQAESAGDALAQSAVAVTSEEASQSEKAEALTGLGGVLLEAGSRFVKYRENIDRQQEEHAKGVEIEKATDKPRCECGYVFSQIPQTANRVSCPDCGEEYEVKNPE